MRCSPTLAAALLAAALLAAALLASLGLTAQAGGLQGQSQALFDSMLTTTNPSAHMGQRRGVFDGGAVSARTRLVSEPLIGFSRPSWEAGCGGIDLYAGSFSFINADQFTALLRAIAANATGYAFQMALSVMSPTAMEIINKLQDTVQKLNQGFSNSCQLAQGLVNDAVAAYDGKLTAQTSQTLTSTGIGDVFQTWTASTGSGPATQARTSLSPDKRATANLEGNVVWQALKRGDVGSRFKGGDDALLEAIMSITGTVIVGAPQPAPDKKGDSAPVSVHGSLLSVRELVTGPSANNEVTVYRCDNKAADQCRNPKPTTVSNFVGFGQYVQKVLFGDGGTAGVIDKAHWGDAAPTASEAAFLEVAPHGLGAMLHDLAQHDPALAKQLGEQAAPVIGLELAKVLLDDVFRMTQQATAWHGSPYAKEVADRIRQSKEDLDREYATLSQRHGSLQSLMDSFAIKARLVRGAVLDSSSEPPIDVNSGG